MLYVNDNEDFVFAIFTIVYLHVGVCYCLHFCTLENQHNAHIPSSQNSRHGTYHNTVTN